MKRSVLKEKRKGYAAQQPYSPRRVSHRIHGPRRILQLEKIAEALESEAHREGLPIPAGRGLSAPFRRMVDFLRQRRLVQDLGVQTVPITWLSFHVPPVGSGTLKWAATNAAESSFRACYELD